MSLSFWLMEQKKKICIGCGKEKYIFSKKRCITCASIVSAKKSAEKASQEPQKKYTIPKTTLKNKARRSEERAGYGDFFARHISVIKTQRKKCQECGAPLQGLTGEVAHILSKSKSPEVATNDDNVLYLCFYGNSCHSLFDSTLSKREKMSVFSQAVKQYNLFKDNVVTWNKEVAQLEDSLTKL